MAEAKLVSMKVSPAKRKEMTEPSLSSLDQPYYPWGLSITLDDDSLKKLGIDELPKVGAGYMLVAKVKVTGVSANESESSSNRSVSLQIEEMCLESPEKRTATEDLLYPKK